MSKLANDYDRIFPFSVELIQRKGELSMRKRILLLLMILVLSISLIACSNSTSQEREETATETETAEEVASEGTEEQESQESGPEVEETDIGIMTRYKTNKDLNLEQQTGPFVVRVLASQLATLETNEDSKPMFDNKDKVTILTLQVEVENTSEETNSIYPNQGTVVTNTKEQVECDLFLSEDVGGDFIGQVVKKGDIFFILDSDPEEITDVKYIISAPHDENFDTIGEDITFELSF